MTEGLKDQSNIQTDEQSHSQAIPQAQPNRLEEERRNRIVIGIAAVIIMAAWYNYDQQPAIGIDGPATPGITKEYLHGTWQARTQYASGNTILKPDGTFMDRTEHTYPNYRTVTNSGAWSLSNNVLTMRISNSNVPQIAGTVNTFTLQLVSRNECKATSGNNPPFSMQRMQ